MANQDLKINQEDKKLAGCTFFIDVATTACMICFVGMSSDNKLSYSLLATTILMYSLCTIIKIITLDIILNKNLEPKIENVSNAAPKFYENFSAKYERTHSK